MSNEFYKDEFGLDWLMFVVVPEKDFMRGVQRTAVFALLTGVAALIGSIGLGLLATRWLVRPILQLDAAAMQVKNHNFEPDSIVQLARRPDELGHLAQVFQEMAQVIQAREQSLEDQVQQLLQESDNAKKAALATRLGGTVNLQALLSRSQQARQVADQQRQHLPDLLRSVSYFQGFDDHQLQRLISLGYQTRVSQGTYICHEDEPGDSFYIILAGRVEVHLERPPKSLNILTAGSFFGELSLLLGVPRSATVKAIEDTILFAVDRKSLQILLRDYCDLGEEIAQKLNQHKAELDRRKDTLRQHGLLDDERTFNQNFLDWIRQRLMLAASV